MDLNIGDIIHRTMMPSPLYKGDTGGVVVYKTNKHQTVFERLNFDQYKIVNTHETTKWHPSSH